METLFGTSANFTRVQQEFSHPRNHLVPIWQGTPTPEIYPDSVWRFLTQPSIRDVEAYSYSTEDLQARIAMLHMLESNVQLMHQDLETLLREILIRQAMEEDLA